jgi:pimeloyl-ACP methyl ester carboxylesterase
MMSRQFMTVSNPTRRRMLTLMAGTALLRSDVVFAGGGESPMTSTNFRAEVGAQEPRRTITLDGIPIAYSDTGGNGPVLICLHAIGHGARDFQDLSRRLAPQFRVIAIDFPGQGNSGPDTQPASGTRYTQLLSLFIEKLALRPVILVGNSIGGAVSVRYANQHSEYVRALVLCDAGGLAPPLDDNLKGFVESYVQFFETGSRGDPKFGAAFAEYYRKILIEKPALAERDRIVRSAYEIAPILVQAWQSFARPEESLWDVLPAIRCPVLLAWAKDDTTIPLDVHRPIFERFPNHHLEVFAGGHAAFLEDPDQFEQKLRQFIGTLPD